MLGILLVMHEALGEMYIQCASTILAESFQGVEAVRIDPQNHDIAALHKIVDSAIKKVDEGSGVLILTDLCGATPCNTSMFEEQYHDRLGIISGVNFPMLLKVLTNRNLPLDAAMKAALEAGKKGIVNVVDVYCNCMR